jgi:hypothetical protein
MPLEAWDTVACAATFSAGHSSICAVLAIESVF